MSRPPSVTVYLAPAEIASLDKFRRADRRTRSAAAGALIVRGLRQHERELDFARKTNHLIEKAQ